MFLSFDGVDGTGKTTQIGLLADSLRARGRAVATCRDPGSTPLGERVRKILLDDDPETVVGARSEMFLYMAAREEGLDVRAQGRGHAPRTRRWHLGSGRHR